MALVSAPAPVPPLEERLRALSANPERLQRLKEGMARFLAVFLSIRDAGVVRQDVVEPTLVERAKKEDRRKLARRPSLAQAFLDVGAYLPTVESLQDAHEFEGLLRRIREVRQMEYELSHKTTTLHVLLAPYLRYTAFRKSISIPLKSGTCSVGGTRHRLAAWVKDEVCEWLKTIAKTLEGIGVDASEPGEFARALEHISNAVSRRISLVCDESSSLPDVDALRTTLLADFADLEFQVDESHFFACVCVLLELAAGGSTRFDVDRDAPALRACALAVIPHLDEEVGFAGVNAARSHLQKLHVAVMQRHPGPFWPAVDTWRASSGAFAHLALADVLFYLANSEPLAPERRILRAGTVFAADAVRLPPATFCAPLREYEVAGERIGESTTAQCLWLIAAQLLHSPGELERGIVSRSAAQSAYYEAVQESATLVAQVRQATEHLRVGIPLRDFLRQIIDRESFNFPKIRAAMCELSWFSWQEISDVFKLDSPLYRGFADEFQTLTAANLTVELPRNSYGAAYTGFARDGLMFGLPMIFAERQARGISTMCSSTYLADLVQTLNFQKCHMVNGVLWVPKRALATAHPGLLEVLKHFVSTGHARHGRPWLPSASGRKKHTADVYQVPLRLLEQF